MFKIKIFAILALSILLLSSCSLPLTRKGAMVKVVSDTDKSNFNCEFLGIVSGSMSMGNSTSHDAELAMNETRNKAASMGGNAIKILNIDSDVFATTVSAEALKCSEYGKKSKTHKVTLGTGFAVSSSGTLVTAYHIVERADKIHVKFSGGKWIPAKLIRYSRSTDAAILQTANIPPAFLHLKRTNPLKPGDSVFTMGYPVVELLGPEAKYTDGKISSLSGIKGEDSLMQITVPVQPGNSGGPLVASDGYVVGIITSTAAVKYFYAITESLPQNINWAVKADYILPMLGEGDLEGSEIIIDNPVQKTSKAICLIKSE